MTLSSDPDVREATVCSSTNVIFTEQNSIVRWEVGVVVGDVVLSVDAVGSPFLIANMFLVTLINV